MKRTMYCIGLLLACYGAMAQNVGIGESSPAAKLTIKSSDAFSKSLLVKTTSDDTAMFIYGHSHYLNGYSNSSSATLTLNNKYFVPGDNAQLTILASGERSGINAAGSLGTLEFRNINSPGRFNFSSYTGAVATHNLGFYYNDGSSGISQTLMYFLANGNTGIGTFTPVQKLHLHNSTGTNNSYAMFTNPTTGQSATDGLLVGVNSLGNAFINNQESSRLHFGTANVNRMIISDNGNIGIGTDPTTEKLEVAGNINASGSIRATEVVRTSTGSANLVPIAYGNISSSGFVQSGSGNFTVSKISTGWYSITITGESYQFQTYSTVATPAGNVGPIMTNTGSGGGNLYVYTYAGGGAAADSQFCFVVYKQ
jgi:hypothetical protein